MSRIQHILSAVAPWWCAFPKRLVVAGMATMPSRAHTFPTAFKSIVDQVDLIYLYLDGHSDVPDPAKNHPRVIAIFSRDIDHLHASGKFLALSFESTDALYVGIDDDIAYPPDYVIRLRAGLDASGGRAVVGYHGSFFTQPFVNYQRSRHVITFYDKLATTMAVDLLGSGTVMFDMAFLRFDVRQWSHANMNDLHLAIEAAHAKLPLICLRRRASFLRPLEMEQTDSIYTTLKLDDSAQTKLARHLQALKSTNDRRAID